MKQLYVTIVVIFTLLRLLFAQSTSCEPFGLCHETTKSCIKDDLGECFPNRFHRDMRYGYDLSGGSIDTTCLPSSKNQFTVTINNLSTIYVHVNPWYVDVCLFWSIAESNMNYVDGQYKIRFNSDYKIIKKFCIGHNQTSVCIKDVHYENLNDYTVDVLPNPLASDDDERQFMRSQKLSRLKGCMDEIIQQKTEACTSQYSEVQNLLVMSRVCNNSKTLNVSWDHPSNVTQPEEYYIEVVNYPTKHFFKVANATQVLVKRLNASIVYKVKVTAYRRCSGLGKYDFDERKVGCGKSHEVYEKLLNDSCIEHEMTTLPLVTLTASVTSMQNNTAVNVKSKILHFIVGAFLGAIIISVLIFTAAAILAFQMKSKKSLVHPIQTDFKVFLFYLPSMVQTKQEHVHSLITTVAKYFSVITMDELINGDVTQWLERTVNSADIVLILASKEFFKDWQSKTRCTELYCIESLISAAIVQDTIAKFAFISTENSAADVHIPENSYLKLMRVFLLGTKVNQETELYRFVTKSRGILLEEAGDHFKDAQIKAKSSIIV